MEIAYSPWMLRLLRVFFVALGVFLYAPILLLGLFSFNDNPTPAFPLSGLTLRWYRQFLQNAELVSALRASLTVATVSSVIAVILALAISFALIRRRFTGKPLVFALVLSPLVIPYLVFGVSLLILFKTLDQLLVSAFGIYVGLGLHVVVIGHVVVSLPYAVLTIYPRLERLSVALDEAARDLGAGAFQAVRRVTLPLLFPAILSAFLVSFTLSFDEYAIASFVTGSTITWPVYLFAQLRFPVLLPQIIAVSVIIMTISILLVIVAELLRRRSERPVAA